MCKLYILMWLSLDFVVGISFKELKNCNTQKILLINCPPQTRCVEQPEQKPRDYEGVCQCNSGYIFNPNYTSDIDYCKVVDENTKQFIKQLNRNDSSDENAVINDKPNAQHDEKFKSIQPHHHIIAGVLIPIFLVLMVIGGVFAYKKLHITRHIRNSVRRTHRSRPFYEDVMLGANDNDDPPLI